MPLTPAQKQPVGANGTLRQLCRGHLAAVPRLDPPAVELGPRPRATQGDAGMPIAGPGSRGRLLRGMTAAPGSGSGLRQLDQLPGLLLLGSCSLRLLPCLSLHHPAPQSCDREQSRQHDSSETSKQPLSGPRCRQQERNIARLPPSSELPGTSAGTWATQGPCSSPYTFH